MGTCGHRGPDGWCKSGRVAVIPMPPSRVQSDVTDWPARWSGVDYLVFRAAISKPSRRSTRRRRMVFRCGDAMCRNGGLHATG
ncbi:hypothetical protein GDI3501 [Gluconacetobacter diazotrophicus PA1 5]|uniref:Uncharacterized protein n=1 Tax=Gluconacetobacter diazotrophicus (strain ATCC 49037 / DSM 5601 / CCUG 37298 / CIP 103539 / LMG 7603 / PAl5) TaxID=272568 RepID=A9H4J2_GLUDA|nr:hypothetical protein GDI3501 [Gluconacetobacter diazotrophicus PA1 5]